MVILSAPTGQRNGKYGDSPSPCSTASFHSLDEGAPRSPPPPGPPLFDDESARDLDTLLTGGSCVRSYEGTSQYAQRGISSCGIASFNSIRIVFDLEEQGYGGLDLILAMMTRDLVERTVEICSSWTSAAHLEAEDIHDMPIFRQVLNIIENEYQQATEDNFLRLLRRLRDLARPGRSAAVVLTKPPEIITVFAIATGVPELPVVFVVFDSHSRPNVHPFGAAFLFFGALTEACRYLTHLLSVDPSLLRESGMQWETQLLSQYTAHYIVAAINVPTSNSILYEANIALLDVKPSMAALQDRVEESTNENSSLRSEIAALKERLNEYERDREQLRKERKNIEKELKSVRNSQGGWFGSHKDEYQPPTERERRRKDKGKSKDSIPAEIRHSPPPPVFQPVDPRHEKKHRPTSTTTANQPRAGRDSQGPVNGGGWGVFDTGSVSTSHQQNKPPAPRQPGFGHGISNPGYSVRVNGSSSFDKSQTSWHTAPDHQSNEDRLLALRLQEELRQQDLEDARLAAAMQADFDAEDRRVRDDHFQALSTATQTFDCVICMETHPEDSVARINACGHEYCRSCLRSHLATTLQEGKFPVRCPVCASNPQRGEVAVVSRDLAELLGLTEEESQAWWKFELTTLAVRIECRKCKRTALIDKSDHDAADLITCPYVDCEFVYCPKCSQEVSGKDASQHSCDGSKEMEVLTRAQGWRHCPGCGALVEKTQGCNHMTCRTPGCNTHFDYASGARMR